jgi:phosphohistidine swiveling domain-containing protein
MTSHVVYQGPGGVPFPVDWAQAADHSKDEWRWDQVHNPTPLTPLAQDMIAIKRQGMYRGGEITGRPFHEERMYANGYGFSRSLKGDPASDELARKVAERDHLLRVDRIVELWETSYRPETEALTRSLKHWAAPDDTLSQLLSTYDQVEAAWRRCGELHTISTGLASVAMREFDEFCNEKFGGEGTRVAVESISGMPNMSVESGKALWELSRQVINRPSVADLIRTRTPKEFMVELDAVPEGPEFRRVLERFLEVWGQRNESYYELGFLTWNEDPDFVLSTLRTYIYTPVRQSPSSLHERAAETRLAMTQDVKSRLTDPQDFGRYLILQSRAQQYTVLMEDHNYYIDQRAYTSLRTPHQAIGARMVDGGGLEHALDVFYLHVEEIKDHANHMERKYQSLVTERRAERKSWMHVLPPVVIGGDAPLALTTTGSSVVGRDLSKAVSVKGLPASAGTVVGTARVILSLGDSYRLSPGEILVTYATSPPWTPLFVIAAAVVTDAGGPLAHCAVVAREYGLPAIVGTGNATSCIEDGMTIRVDGTTGIVTLEG